MRRILALAAACTTLAACGAADSGPDGKVVFTNADRNDANVLPGATIADNLPLAGLNDLAGRCGTPASARTPPTSSRSATTGVRKQWSA